MSKLYVSAKMLNDLLSSEWENVGNKSQLQSTNYFISHLLVLHSTFKYTSYIQVIHKNYLNSFSSHENTRHANGHIKNFSFCVYKVTFLCIFKKKFY